MELQDDLNRIAEAAAPHGAAGEELAGVLAAETTTGRVYLCAFRAGETTSWLALDDRGAAVTDPERVREAASLVALSELAEESAGGGELDELLARLVALRLTENPEGIDDAEDVVRALQQVIGGPPRLASPEYVDSVGAAARRLEQALGDPTGSPFAEAMKASAGAVQGFVADVQANLKPLP